MRQPMSAGLVLDLYRFEIGPLWYRPLERYPKTPKEVMSYGHSFPLDLWNAEEERNLCIVSQRCNKMNAHLNMATEKRGK